ncbi:MAG: hypothetical protein ABSH34_21430, partial [Verrucomicrobiota bacterium]
MKLTLASCVSALAMAVTLHASDFFVAPTGNDANPGTADRPFATLERARDAVRQLKQAGLL